jgi:iron complex outermembrane recepter protein
MKLSTVVLGAAACASTLAPNAVRAQQQQPAVQTTGDIIVTARKRQESILNVPVVETAIPKAQLERLQTQDLKDVATLVPGLSIGDAVLDIGTQVSLRGVGTSTLDAGVDQSVSLNLDGLQISNGLAYASGLFDLQQAEVLKGPQALFYGKNSPGGVISLRTADPGPSFELIGQYGHEFEADENRESLIVSGPVTDTLGLRLAALYDTSDGFFTNTAVGLPASGSTTPTSRSNPPTESYVIRLTGVWKPNSQFSARLKLNLAHDKVTEPAMELTSCPNGNIAPFGIPFMGNATCKLGRSLQVVDLSPAAFPGITNNGVPFSDTTQVYGTYEMNYKLRPDINLTSTTGVYSVRYNGMINAIETTDAAPPIVAENAFHRYDITEELRANSDFSGPFNFTAGAYFQVADEKNLVSLLGNTIYGLPGLLLKGSHDLNIHSTSVFAQGRYKIIPKVEVALGARWQEETRTDDPQLNFGPPVPLSIPDPRIHSDNVSPEVTITYKPTDDATIFGSYKRAYKSGSYTITVPATPGSPDAFGDERVGGFEAGAKTRWLQRQLIVDLAVYDYQYKGLQVGANSPAANGIPVIETVNAGGALVYGVDFDAAYRPDFIPGFNLHTGVEWNHARFKVLDNVPCWGGQTIAEGCNQFLNPATSLYTSQNLQGTPLVRAPDWQVNFGADYERRIGHDLTVILSSSNEYSSRYLTDLGLRQDFYQKGYIKADFSVTVQGPQDRWEIALIGKNLNNALTTGSCTNYNLAGGQVFGGQVTGGTGAGPAGKDELGCFIDRGREVWMRLTLKPFNR